MVKDINDLGSYSGPKTATEPGGKKAAETATSAPSSVDTGSAEKDDDVQLSSTAKTLQSMADKINSLPDVNVERVGKIKAALENAEYKVDNLVLADSILNSDALL